MRVLIDSGNSRVKFGWLDHASGAREASALALEHAQVKAQTLHAWLKTLPRAPRAAIGANVAGDAAARRIRAALGLPVRWVRAQACAGGVRNGYTNPGQLGADRWMALLGLVASAPPPGVPLVFAHYGTATTIDTLSPQGDDGVRDFVGGVILPGVSLMRASLAQHTAQLPLAQGQATRFARNTDQGIVSGVCAAQAGALAQQWWQTLTHFGCAPALYVSGGGWGAVARTVQDALQEACRQAHLPAQAPRVLTSPVLDGLALGVRSRTLLALP